MTKLGKKKMRMQGCDSFTNPSSFVVTQQKKQKKKKRFSTLLFGLRFTILCDEDLVQHPPPLENAIVKCIN